MNKRPTLSLKSPAKSKPAAPKLRSSHARDLKPALQTGFQTRLKPDSLAYSLIGAASAIAQVKNGTNLPQALALVWAQHRTLPRKRAAPCRISPTVPCASWARAKR
jgi:16S rRNA (cytosine967-C5)-methyltransferase